MIRVAIVGAGIGAEHLRGYLALPDRYQVHTICDLDTARAAPLAQQAGARIETSFDAVLADPGIDLIDICLPAHLHVGPTIQALEAGKAVVCEKPIAPSLSEIDRMEDAVARSGRPVFPVFQYRYGIGMAQMRAVIDAGLTGTPFVATLETHWNRDRAYYDIPWRGTWAGEMGGVLISHAIHIHDLLPLILGPVERVQAELATRVNPIEVEDCAALTMRFASGALAVSSVTLGAADDTSRLRLVFENVTVESGLDAYAPAATPWRFTARGQADQARIDEVLSSVEATPVGFAGQLTAVADALEGRGGQEVTLADGRASIAFATAAYEAARSGAGQTLPLGKDHPLYGGWAPN